MPTSQRFSHLSLKSMDDCLKDLNIQELKEFAVQKAQAYSAKKKEKFNKQVEFYVEKWLSLFPDAISRWSGAKSEVIATAYDDDYKVAQEIYYRIEKLLAAHFRIVRGNGKLYIYVGLK